MCAWVDWCAIMQVLSAQDGSEVKEMFYDARCDIDSVEFCDSDHEVEAVVVDYTKQEWVVYNDRIKADVAALQAVCTGASTACVCVCVCMCLFVCGMVFLGCRDRG
jgi:hypothetical protein